MRRFLLLAPLAFALPTVACGSGSSTVNPLEVNLTGSYELTIGAVARTGTTYPGPTPGNTTPPSQNAIFRLDLRRSGNTYEAVVTPTWGTPTPMTVTTASGSLVLTGETNVSGPGQFGGVYDRWQTITIPVDESGLTSGVTLTGDEMVSEGDVGWNYDISAGASVARDHRPPQVKNASGGSAAGKFLPWDRFRVITSEPVDAAKLKTSVQASVGTTNAVFTSPDVGNGTDWAGHVLLEGGFDNFDVPGGAGILTIQPGIPDLAGNAGPPTSEPQKVAFEVAELGAPQIALDFDGKPNTSPALWGKAQIVQGADCEAGGGCATFGVFQQSYCSSSSDGIAARLSGAGAKTLAFRYRVHVEPQFGGSENMFTNTTVLSVDLARAGAAKGAANVTMPKLVAGGTKEKPVFDSDWVDGSVAIPSGGANLAFAIRPTSLYPYGCGGGPAPAPVDVTVWIDSLRME